MQQTLTPDDPQEHQHHHHEHHLLPPAPPPPPPGHHYHNPSPFLASSQCPSSLQDFRGMAPVVGKRAAMYGGGGGEEEAEVSDEGSGENWKKRRLSVEQVRTLEKNFEVGNKLEPERKAQLARALGLQPRQVAIWFQNRRARWKTKQLEKDYDALSRRLDDLKAHNHALLSHNNKLQAEIAALKGRDAASELINLNKETEASCSNRSENSSEINLDISRTPPPSDSPLDAPPPPHQDGGGMIPFYPSVARGPGAVAGVDIDQLLHSSDVPKMEHAGGNVQAADTASFGNLLCGVDEPPPFWPWADHQHFH